MTPEWQRLLDRQPQVPKGHISELFKKHGWLPPSTHCPDTMAKHKAFREWAVKE